MGSAASTTAKASHVASNGTGNSTCPGRCPETVEQRRMRQQKQVRGTPLEVSRTTVSERSPVTSKGVPRADSRRTSVVPLNSPHRPLSAHNAAGEPVPVMLRDDGPAPIAPASPASPPPPLITQFRPAVDTPALTPPANEKTSRLRTWIDMLDGENLRDPQEYAVNGYS